MPIRPIATKIISSLQEKGHVAYFAGGWVRDHLLSHPSDDIDIATSASIEDVQALFPKTIPVGIAFGIVIVVQDGHHFEVATFRTESEYADGRRPSRIEKATAEEDAKRRDFTINGLFFDPLTEEIFDFVSGQEDLKKGVIRAIGDEHHRFLEDRLRMIRAVRYSIRFNFPIEEKTKEAILAHASDLFPSVAIERVWQEFEKMSRFASFGKALGLLYDLGLLVTIFPSLKDTQAQEIKKRLEPFPTFPPSCPLILELLHLFPEGSLEKHLELTDYLKLSRKERENVRFYHRAKSLLTMPPSWQENLENAELAEFYAHPLSDLCLFLLKAPSFHSKRKEILAPYIKRIQNKDPLIKAKDLDIPPSPKLGLLLKEAERISINALTQDKQKVLSALKKNSLWISL